MDKNLADVSLAISYLAIAMAASNLGHGQVITSTEDHKV